MHLACVAKALKCWGYKGIAQMKKRLAPLLAFLLIFIFSACTSGAYMPELAARNTPRISATADLATPVLATPELTPAPADADKIVHDEFVAAFAPDFSDFTFYNMAMEYSDIAHNAQDFKQMEADLLNEMEEAMAHAQQQLYAAHGDNYTLVYLLDVMDWQAIAALGQSFTGEIENMLRDACICEVKIEDAVVTAKVSFKDLRSIVAGSDAETAFAATLKYCYLNTVYDDNGFEKDYEHYDMGEEYIASLMEPLELKHITRMKDGWYDPRSQSTRKHTGVDICANKNTDIFSCTNGTVAYIDTNGGAGNYVVVLDDYGYEYHYYHMVRLTDFLSVGERVVQGQLIGNVGNTGNSDTNHLHLTIISPIYTFINPYTVIMEMRAKAE